MAVSALVIVAALVGFLAFGLRRGSGSAAHATPSPVAQAASTPLPLGITTPTAAATAVATEAAETPTPEATTAPKATTVAKTPAATAAPTVGPTAAPTSAAKPPLGAYGELPAANIPTGNSAGRQLSLDYRLNLSLQQVPQSAPVYQLQPRNWTKDDVTLLAKSLGLTGQVVDQGGSFKVSGGGDLYVTGNFVQYIAATGTGTPTGNNLPSDSAAVDIARSWLIKHDLVGGNVGAGQVVGHDTTAGKIQVRVMPADPSDILSATPSATVTIGLGGAVLEADCRWPGTIQQSSYGLSPAEDLWSAAQGGQGYVEIDPNALPSGAVSGTATITGASLAYTIAGPPDGVQYLVPLVVFTGQADIQGASGSIPIKVYVPAVTAQSAPRG